VGGKFLKKMERKKPPDGSFLGEACYSFSTLSVGASSIGVSSAGAAWPGYASEVETSEEELLLQPNK
jgi:hypothetical protein